MVAEMLQKSKFLLYVLYSSDMMFYFCYIFHIYVICFINLNVYYIFLNFVTNFNFPIICVITLLFSLNVQTCYNVKFLLSKIFVF